MTFLVSFSIARALRRLVRTSLNGSASWVIPVAFLVSLFYNNQRSAMNFYVSY